MGATNLVVPEKDSPEGYEQEIDLINDGLAAGGFYPQVNAGVPDLATGIERDISDNLILKDPNAGSKTLMEILSATAGVTEAVHKTLLQLIHFIDEGPAEGFTTGATKTVTGTVFPTQVLWKRADATKLVEKNITWTGPVPTTIQWKMYGLDGITVLATVTDTITYSGPFETGRTRAIS